MKNNLDRPSSAKDTYYTTYMNPNVYAYLFPRHKNRLKLPI